MAKVSLNYPFDYPFANIDEVRFTLFVPLFNQVLHVKKMKQRKFLSVFQMTEEASCSEKRREMEFLCFSSQEATTGFFLPLITGL